MGGLGAGKRAPGCPRRRDLGAGHRYPSRDAGEVTEPCAEGTNDPGNAGRRTDRCFVGGERSSIDLLQNLPEDFWVDSYGSNIDLELSRRDRVGIAPQKSRCGEPAGSPGPDRRIAVTRHVPGHDLRLSPIEGVCTTRRHLCSYDSARGAWDPYDGGASRLLPCTRLSTN